MSGVLVSFNVSLIRVEFFSEFSDLNLVVGSIKQLAFSLFELDPQHFHFIGQPFNLNCLEYNNKVYGISQVGLLIVG